MENIAKFLQDEFENMMIFHQNGCDEFYILMENYNNSKSGDLVERIRYRFRKEHMAAFLGEEYRTVRITFSAGIASWPENGDKDVIIKKAFTALFLAKAMRRNQVQCYMEESTVNTARCLLCPEVKIEVYAGKWGEIGRVRGKILRKESCFWEPQAIATSKDGRVYIVDQNNHQILQVEGEYITPIVGMGDCGRIRHGIPATEGRMNKPTGLCVSHKKIYITDTGNDMVICLDMESGRLYRVCGTGQPGYCGDGGMAQDALLNKPGGAAVDAYGNLYINDIANNVIRKIDHAGIVSTFAGNGDFGFYGDGGAAIHACFNEIYGISMDSRGENLYLADYFNHRIRRINTRTGHICTIAGNGYPGYAGDGGPPEEAALNRPVAVCTDQQDNIYIAESGNHSVRIIKASQKRIYTLAGGCGMGSGLEETAEGFRLANPNSLAVSGQTLFILDGANNRLCRINLLEGLK